VAELGLLSRPDLVPGTVATALGLSVGAGAVSREAIAAAVGSKQLLLLVDNCEHLIDAAAGVVEALLRVSPSAVVLATSREPLRVSGEYIHRVPPLAVPPEDNRHLKTLFDHAALQLSPPPAPATHPHHDPHPASPP